MLWSGVSFFFAEDYGNMTWSLYGNPRGIPRYFFLRSTRVARDRTVNPDNRNNHKHRWEVGFNGVNSDEQMKNDETWPCSIPTILHVSFMLGQFYGECRYLNMPYMGLDSKGKQLAWGWAPVANFAMQMWRLVFASENLEPIEEENSELFHMRKQIQDMARVQDKILQNQERMFEQLERMSSALQGQRDHPPQVTLGAVGTAPGPPHGTYIRAFAKSPQGGAQLSPTGHRHAGREKYQRGFLSWRAAGLEWRQRRVFSCGHQTWKKILSIVFNTYSDLYFSEVRRADHLARKRRGSS